MRSISLKAIPFLLLLTSVLSAQQLINMDTGLKGSRLPFFGTDSGSANAYVVTTIAPLGPTLRTGSCFIFFAANGNTTASTLNVDSTGVKSIKKNVSTALASGDIAANGLVETCYDGTNYQIVSNGSLGSGGGGSGTVTSVDQTSPSGVLSVSGGPITSSGTFTWAWSGTSGGVPYFSSSSALASSALLTNHALMLGGGSAAAPKVLGSLGTTSTLLHGNASGDPSFGSVDLASEVGSSILPVGNGGNGTATPTLTAGTNVSLSGSWPNYTISATASGGGSTISPCGGYSSVAFSATPTFDAANGDIFKITLTGDVTSSTFSNGVTGCTYTFIVCQDSTGGRAFVPPTSMHQYDTWMASPSQCSTQEFAYDGTNLNAVEPWSPDTRPFTANAMDDEFDGNALNTSTLWTAYTAPTTTTMANGWLTLRSTAAGNTLKGYYQALPSTPWQFDAYLCASSNQASSTGASIGLSDGTKYETFSIYGNSSAYRLAVERWTNATTFSSTLSVLPGMPICGFVRIMGDGTNLYYYYSATGAANDWYLRTQEAKGTWFSTAPTRVTINIQDAGNPAVASFKFFRRTQ